MALQDRVGQHEDWKDGQDAFRQWTKEQLEDIHLRLRAIEYALKLWTLDLNDDLKLKHKK